MSRMLCVAAAAFLLFSLIGVAPALAKQDYRLGTVPGGSHFELMEQAGIGWDLVDFGRSGIERQPG